MRSHIITRKVRVVKHTTQLERCKENEKLCDRGRAKHAGTKATTLRTQKLLFHAQCEERQKKIVAYLI